LGELKLNLPKDIATHNEDSHVARHKVDTVKRILDEQRGKATGAAGRNMSFSSAWDYGSFSKFVFLVLFMPLL
jgi:hypothetical protein